MNKIKKKIYKDLTSEQLRMMLPFEELLRRAILDEESSVED